MFMSWTDVLSGLLVHLGWSGGLCDFQPQVPGSQGVPSQQSSDDSPIIGSLVTEVITANHPLATAKLRLLMNTCNHPS